MNESFAGRAQAAFARVRAWALRKNADFQRQSKFFRYRVYIIAAYLGVALVTVLAVIPKGGGGRLNAYVLAAHGDFVVGAYIMVRNESSRDWANVIFTVNGTHQTSAPRVAKGERVTLPLSAFKAITGPDVPLDERELRELSIVCSRGQEAYPIAFVQK